MWAGTRLISVALALVGAPALADVKTGIDAYQRGDFAGAVIIWRPLATTGDADAQYNIGQAYRLGRGVPVDPKVAENWFRQAADQGHQRARNAYGLTLFQTGRRAEAIPLIEESAGHGFPQSQYVYATLLFNGDMVTKDWVRSYALMTRAAAGDVAAAKTALAQLDKHIPVEQRQRGLKLAEVFANAAPKAPDMVGTPIAVAVLPPSVVAAKPDSRPDIVAAPRGGWRIQLGAFGNTASATTLWDNLKARVGSLAPLQSYYVPAGALTKLQAGPLPARADADKLCAAVKASGNVCVVVAPAPL